MNKFFSVKDNAVILSEAKNPRISPEAPQISNQRESRVPHLRRSFIAPKVGEAPQNHLSSRYTTHMKLALTTLLTFSLLAPINAQTATAPKPAQHTQAQPWTKIPIPPLHAFTPQKPKRQAWQRDQARIDAWVKRDWPRLVKKGLARTPTSSSSTRPAACSLPSFGER